MEILILTIVEIDSIEERGLYKDLIRKFRDEGHQVTVVSPVERRKKVKTNIQQIQGINLLQVKTFNFTKANFLEKGIATLAIEFQFLSAIKKFLSFAKFNLIVYSTPPITFYNIIHFIKKRDNAYSYLLLKDIFPQNAVDMQLMKKSSFLYKYFEKKEKKLYEISDTIGCMSPANVKYILNNNRVISPTKVEVNPNSIQPIEIMYSKQEKDEIRLKYALPINKKIFVYGGNLGKPQGIDFFLDTIKHTIEPNAYFLIVGNGTEFGKIQQWMNDNKPGNAKLLNHLPKDDYVRLVAACDVGLIFLHHNFTIPNFPSRLLTYLEMRLPVISATDTNTDIGDILEQYKCGYKVIAGNLEKMKNVIYKLTNIDSLSEMGENSWTLLNKEYLVQKSYDLIIKKIND